MVIDILEGQKGDQGGDGQNSTWCKTGHLKNYRQKMAKILGGVKFQHFGPPLRQTKCF